MLFLLLLLMMMMFKNHQYIFTWAKSVKVTFNYTTARSLLLILLTSTSVGYDDVGTIPPLSHLLNKLITFTLFTACAICLPVRNTSLT